LTCLCHGLLLMLWHLLLLLLLWRCLLGATLLLAIT
jgi:hypothetical protein